MTLSNNSESFFQAVETRRSYYNLTNKASISDEEIQKLIERAIKFTPSSYNVQSSRAVVVLGDKHTQLWDAVWEAQKGALGGNEELIKTFEGKFEGAYKPGYGTVVFFEDQVAVDKLIESNPMLAGAMPTFTGNTAGIAQFIVWTALAAEGMGASLQHYAGFGPAQAAAVTKALGVPAEWSCTAMMPFGVPAGETYPKTFAPIEDRVKVIA